MDPAEVKSWTADKVEDWVRENFSEDAALACKDQQVDGETLLLLSCSGSIEQLKICGFKTIKDQLTLKKVISEDDGSNLKKTNSIRPTGEAKPSSSKLTLSEMKCMSAEEKRLYLSKRNQVAEAARTKWPGNDIPIFRNHPSNLNQLNNLVTKLTPECSLPCFNPKQIRKHILDTLTERRRNVKRGHDYDSPEPYKKTSKVKVEMNESGDECQGKMKDLKQNCRSNDHINSEPISVNSACSDDDIDDNDDDVQDPTSHHEPMKKTKTKLSGTDKEQPIKIAAAKKNLEVNKSGDQCKGKGKDLKQNCKSCDHVSRQPISVSSIYSCSDDDDDDDVQDPTPDEPIKKSNYKVNDHDKDKEKTVKATTAKGSKDKKRLTVKSCEVVVATAFQSHFIKEVSRSQMDGAIKILLSKEDRKQLKGVEKAKLLPPLAQALIRKGIVEVDGRADMENLSRLDVKKVGTF